MTSALDAEKQSSAELRETLESLSLEERRVEAELTSAKAQVLEDAKAAEQLQSLLESSKQEAASLQEKVFLLQQEIEKDKLEKEKLQKEKAIETERCAAAEESIKSLVQDVQELKSNKEAELASMSEKLQHSLQRREQEKQERVLVESKCEGIAIQVPP